MYGQKSKVRKIKVVFIITNIVFLLSILLLSFNIEKVVYFFQDKHVNNIIAEVDDALEAKDYNDLSTLVSEKEIELIVMQDEKLIYTSNGSDDIASVDTMYNRGQIYKSLYESGDYLVWLVVYESGLVHTINFALIFVLLAVGTFIVCATIILLQFFKRVSQPLLQLSSLIHKMKNRKSFSTESELDEISSELVYTVNEINFSLLKSKREVKDISNLYNQQKDFIIQQNKHLKTALHDIKNPLAAIQNSSFLLLQDKTLDKDKVDIINRVGVSSKAAHDYITETLNLIINNINDVYYLETEVKIKQTIQNTLELSKLLIENKGVEVIVEGDECYVLTNVLKFNQLISNLLYNALKYSKQNEEITIKIDMGTILIKNTIDRNVLSGNGFGLDRVEEICEELDMDINYSDQGDEYIVELFY